MGERPGKGKYLLWGSLSACASILFLATTNQICQDIGVVPLLWILPLGIYLLTFVICFEHDGWYSQKMVSFGICSLAVGRLFRPVRRRIGQHDRADRDLRGCSLCLLHGVQRRIGALQAAAAISDIFLSDGGRWAEPLEEFSSPWWRRTSLRDSGSIRWGCGWRRCCCSPF